jgi:hypothetical protein
MAKLIRNQGQGSKDAVAVVPLAAFNKAGVDPNDFPRYCSPRDADVVVAISPTSFKYLSRMGEAKRDTEIVGALPFAHVNDRERLWSCDFAMLHGARTEDEVLDWEARVGVKSQSRTRLRLDVPPARASGSVFFDGTDDDVREHLTSLFGTDAFRLEGREIILDLPLVGYDKRPRPSGETTHVRVVAPHAWTIQASERSWWHVVPLDSSSTLCGIELSTWLTPPTQDDERPISCPWCRARMIAIEIASPPAARDRDHWTAKCIYTMRHSDELARAAADGGRATWVESRPWKTGYEVFVDRAPDENVPIIFSAADHESGLIYVGVLDDVVLGGGTTYSVSDLRALPEPRPLSSLTVVSSGEPLPDSYIRPYAVCWTPGFLDSDEIEPDNAPFLHDEIAAVLLEAREPLTPIEIAVRVNARGRYSRRDHAPVPVSQVRARVSKHPQLFTQRGGTVDLRNRE